MGTELAINAAFPPKRCDPVPYYTRLFDRMAQEGVGVLRLWFSDFSFNYYRAGASEHVVRLESLGRVVAAARERSLRILPVLFDFNEFSNTNVHWKERDHSFRSSFLARVLAAPMEFFEPSRLELGLSKFRCMHKIIGTAAAGWELFNEVDQVEGFRLGPVAEWVRRFTQEVRAYGVNDIYLSFSDPSLIKDGSRLLPGMSLGLHTYGWPYSAIYENVIYWQASFPESWVMEFGNEHASAEALLAAMVASHLLNASGRVAVPWYWDRVLSLGVFPPFRRIEAFLDERCGSGRGFEFVGTLGRRGLACPTRSQVLRTFKFAGLRGVVRKGVALFDAWRSSVERHPGLVFESRTHRVALLPSTDPRPKPRIDAGGWASIEVGGLEVAVRGCCS
jgi:hypothetical protein